jgi:hypothetical protein
MRLYAIKELNRDMYVNQIGKLGLLDSTTELFSSKEKAQRCIDGMINESTGIRKSRLKEEIVWSLIEEATGQPRWEVDINMKEYYHFSDSVDLKVVEVELNEL